MAKLIEFCGAPGVGKTTLYEVLSERWKENYNWMPAHKIYPRKVRRQNPVKKFVSAILDREQAVDDKAMRKAGGRFVALYPSYVEQCWAHIMEKEKNGLNGTDQRFEKASHLFKMMQRVQICLENQTTKTVVIEEGLINGIGNALYVPYPEKVDEEINKLFDKLPLPNGLIMVEADVNAVVERVKTRKRFVPSFENISQSDLVKAIEDATALRKVTAEIYREKGYPVLHINAAKPVKQNVDTIFEFVKTFH